MNRLMTRFALLAGLVMLAGTVASAQNLRGKVPFTFNAAGTELPAGTYELARQNSTIPLWVVRNVDTRKQIVLMSPVSAKRGASEAANSTLVFACSGESCALQSLYAAGNAYGYGFPVERKVVPDVRVATVRTVSFGD